ncbi:MAG: hypothetical protein K9J06_00985 [Flavobacteriales bacterium]|nr:hypothetical protein [Flavobacteriales bacterium]
MRSILLSVITATFVLSAVVAQAQDFDKRLTAKFSKKELTEMAKNDAATLAYWNFYLDNGYQIMDIPKGKEDGIQQSITLKSLDAKDINLLALDLPQHDFARQYYLIEGMSGKMLALLPKSEVKTAFDKASK